MIKNLTATLRPLRRSERIMRIQYPPRLLLQYIPKVISHTDQPRRCVPIPGSQPPLVASATCVLIVVTCSGDSSPYCTFPIALSKPGLA